MKFAKLYETDYGQILVKLDACSETAVPEVRFYVKSKILMKVGIKRKKLLTK